MSLRQEGVALRGLFWRAAERAAAIGAARAGLDVAYSVDQNTFNGTTYLELSLADVRPRSRPGMRWQQRLRVGIAVFGVGFVVLLYFALRTPKPRDARSRRRSTRVDRTAAAESTSGEIRRFGVSTRTSASSTTSRSPTPTAVRS